MRAPLRSHHGALHQARQWGVLLVGVGSAVVGARSLGAQVVRGTIHERTSGTTLAGVLVALESAEEAAAPRTIGNVLSNASGDYAVRAPQPGRYRLNVKRIGVERFLSAPFDLATGETRQVDVIVAALAFQLPRVYVSTAKSCSTKGNQPSRVAALWDEARTALTATELSLRDRLFQARITRYVRELDPFTLRVYNERRAGLIGLTERPFSSLSGDSLAQVGYWRRVNEDTTEYWGPDERVLLSDAFLATHCYTAVSGSGDHRGQVGLEFQPSQERDVPDVQGTLWIDAVTFELRSVAFHYTRLLTNPPNAHVGGEVHFARFGNGAWVVRQWFIRMPRYATYVSGQAIGSPKYYEPRLGLFRLIEEGGDVFAEGLRPFVKPAVVEGTVLDSAARPLGGAIVRLSGTPYVTTADARGRFRFDSVPGGSMTLLVEHERYTMLGMLAANEAVSIREGKVFRATLYAPNTAAVARFLCDTVSAPKHATLRLLMVDNAGEPLTALPVWVRWIRQAPREPVRVEKLGEAIAGPTFQGLVEYDGIQRDTDAGGAVTFCGVPTGVALEVNLVRGNDLPIRLTEYTLKNGEVAVRTVKTFHP